MDRQIAKQTGTLASIFHFFLPNFQPLPELIPSLGHFFKINVTKD
jgi:hypothetical protein